MDDVLKKLKAAFGSDPFSVADALALLDENDLPMGVRWAEMRSPGMRARSLGHRLGARAELEKHKTMIGNLYRFRA